MKTLIRNLTLTLTSAAASAFAAPAPDYILHEWGTFTSVSASDGALLPGVEKEEEPLPHFVYSHDGMRTGFQSPFSKGWSRPLANVTVRMETPVIYFYTDKPFSATVDVGFKGGSISQWYPQRSGGETPPPVKHDPATNNILFKESTIDFALNYQGGIQWKVDVIPACDNTAGRVFKFNETLNWLHPRQTDSALVRAENGETEKYLFYRGLGKFEPPVTFTASREGKVTILNRGATATGEMLVFDNDGGQARWRLLSAVAPGESAEVSVASLSGQPEAWRGAVYEEGAKMLERAGLFRKEADAMMQTWWQSYFERQGTRVFWITPRAFTDEILPLTVSPAPKTTVRVMVGRTEILTPDFERRLVEGFAATAENPDNSQNPWAADRFLPAYTRRVEQLRARVADTRQ